MSSKVRTELFHCNATEVKVRVDLAWDAAGVLCGEIRVSQARVELWKFPIEIAMDDRPKDDPSEILSSQRTLIGDDIPVESKPIDGGRACIRRTATCFELLVTKEVAPASMFRGSLSPAVTAKDVDMLAIDVVGSWGIIMAPESE